MAGSLLLPYFAIVKWICILWFSFIGLHFVVSLILIPFTSFTSTRKQQQVSALKQELLQCVHECPDWTAPHCFGRFRRISFLLPILLEIDDKLKEDPRWIEVKTGMAEKWLLPQARKLAYASRWAKRVQATACFLHFPNLGDESHILHLLQDSMPIVQYSAATAAAKLGTSRCVNGVIDQMNRVNRFLRHPFYAALIQGKESVFACLEERLKRDENPWARVSCLEVLSHRMNSHVADLAKKDLYASSKNLRIAAIRAIGHYTDPKSVAFLIPLLKDQEWEVRALAARSLGYLKAKEAVSELSRLLKDEIWWVRMNSALALRRLGEENILQQDASEVAQYVLALGVYD